MDEYLQRIDAIAQQARRFGSYEAREDLDRICGAARDLAQQLSRELVECRRLHRMTARAEVLQSKLEESLDNAEKMLMYARLRYT